jgi:hypothetical protein
MQIKVIVVLTNLNEIYELVEDTKNLINLAKENEILFGLKLQKTLNEFSKVFYFYSISAFFSIFMTTLAFLTASIFFGPPYYVPYVMWAPFDYKNNVIGFSVMTIYQFLSPFITCFNCVTCDMMPAYFFCVIKGLMNELGDRIINFDTELKNLKFNGNFWKNKLIIQKHEKELMEELERLITIHRKILIIKSKAEKIFSPIIFVQAIASSIILCTTAYVISMVIELI